jgi:dolichol-phosphate mannosyltransferase
MNPINRKLVSLISPCFNEAENIDELYRRVCQVMSALPQYDFEYVLIDNASTDGTMDRLRRLAEADARVKVISNMRNFGHLRSPYWGMMQTRGDVTVYLASDLQDPPEVIPQFLAAWEEGWPIALAVKPVSQTSAILHWLRKSYYSMLDSMSQVRLVRDATGFGSYDRSVIDKIREIHDPYPYIRGLICELGYPIKQVPFEQPRRLRGLTKNNFYTLYDVAMLGIVSHSVVPIRLAAMIGFGMGALSILVAIVFLILKLTLWYRYPVGVAPIVIGMFFMFGVVLLFIGVIGEYVASIHTYVRNRPVVVERERINF